MLKKTVVPIIEAASANSTQEGPKVVGSQIEYRIFGLLICRKTLYNPHKYGVTYYEDWYYRI